MLPPTDKSLNDAFFALVHTKSKMEREKVVIAKDREIVLSHLSRFCDEKYNKNRYLELVNEMIFAKGHKTQRNNVFCRYIVEIV